jgi:hypothetical protein
MQVGLLVNLSQFMQLVLKPCCDRFRQDEIKIGLKAISV